jgi:hypothetical protein
VALEATIPGRASPLIAVIDSPNDADGEAWTTARLRATREAYRVEHASLRLDPEARNLRHTYVKPSDDGTAWRVQQMLIDPDTHNDWVMELDVDLAASREANAAVVGLVRVVRLVRVGSLV